MDPRNNPLGELNQFLYTQCYDELCSELSVALGRPVTAVIHHNQIHVEVDGAAYIMSSAPQKEIARMEGVSEAAISKRKRKYVDKLAAIFRNGEASFFMR